MTTHAPERTGAPSSALRLLYEATAGNSQPRLDLDTPSSFRTVLDVRTMAAAFRRRLPFIANVATERVTLMNRPG